MSDAINPIILSLLVRRREMREQGKNPSDAEICAKYPHLLEEFRSIAFESDRADAWLASRETPVGDDTGDFVPTASIPTPDWAQFGSRLQNVRPFASGGMGEVLLATDPQLQAEVIVKVIHARLIAQPEMISRFLWEARVTAQLNHPGIPPVHGIGKMADDRPCYAMRFIAGREMGDLIDQFHRSSKPMASDPTFRDLLTRFATVCKIVAFAHEKNVIHRDLKPRNIRLGEFGETVVLDWGLAKVLGHEPPGVDERGSVLGTQRYMPPEQADGRQEEVDERSDVFALGRILEDIIGANGPKPLKAIVAKATERSPHKRYAGPLALAYEVNHWLADEPVSVHRDSIPVRLARKSRKNPILTTSAIFVILGLVIGFLLALREQAMTAAAEKQMRKERDDKEIARRAANEHAATAIANEKVASDTLDIVWSNALGLVSRQKQLLPEHEEFLKKMYEQNQRLAERAGKDERGRVESARALVRMADIQAQLGRTGDSEQAYRKAIALNVALIREHPDRVEYQIALGKNYGDLSRRLVEQDRFDEAEQAAEDALRTFEAADKRSPNNPDCQRLIALAHDVLGDIRMNTNNPVDAAREFAVALEIRKRLASANPNDDSIRFHVAMANHNLALARFKQGQLTEANKLISNTIDELELLSKKELDDMGYRTALALARMNLGSILKEQGNLKDAADVTEKAVNIYRAARAEFPTLPEYGHHLMSSLANLATLNRKLRRVEPAGKAYQEAESVGKELMAQFPDNPKHQKVMADHLVNMGNVYRDAEMYSEAEAAYRESLRIIKKLQDRQPKADYRYHIAVAELNLGLVFPKIDRLDDAEKSLRNAIRLLSDLRRTSPAVQDFVISMARGHHNLGLLFEQQKKELDGIAELGKSVAILQEIVGSPKTSAEALFLLEKTFEQRARINTKLGRHADAAREFEAIIDLPGPKMPARRFHHAIACIRAGEVNRGLAEIEEVIALKNLPKGWVFMAASAYARASEERQVGDRISTEMRTGFANKAVEFLRQGQAARLFESADEIDLLKTHNDLDPLRTRDDFKQLLKEVEEKAKPKDKE